MPDVGAVIRIMPEGPEVDLTALEAEVRKHIHAPFKIAKVETQPIAFGLKALRFALVAPSMDGLDDLEQTVGALPGVGSASLEQVGLL